MNSRASTHAGSEETVTPNAGDAHLPASIGGGTGDTQGAATFSQRNAPVATTPVAAAPGTTTPSTPTPFTPTPAANLNPGVTTHAPQPDVHNRTDHSQLTTQNSLTPRTSTLTRNTTETQIALTLNLDGQGTYTVSTGIRFFDHMLELFTRHGGFDLDLQCTGDLDIDQHHTVEDVGIALGEAFDKALGDKKGILRAGYFVMPMDETLAVASVDLATGNPAIEGSASTDAASADHAADSAASQNLVVAAIDLSGRTAYVVDDQVTAPLVGDFQTELLPDFFDGFARGVRANVHVKTLYGRSNHHKIEAIFKAFARALRGAVSRDDRMKDLLPSTKGLL